MDPVAWVGAITGIAALAVSIWTRVAQARQWREEPVRARQRELRLEVIRDATTLLEVVEESAAAAKGLESFKLEKPDPARELVDWGISRTHRFTSTDVPEAVAKIILTLQKWERMAWEYGRAVQQFDWARERVDNYKGTDPSELLENLNQGRENRTAAAGRLEHAAEPAIGALKDIIRELERMDSTA